MFPKLTDPLIKSIQ